MAAQSETRIPESRVKVFISYSRADKAFASDLVLGLAACGFAPYIDRQDIAAGEDWAQRLSGLISEADTIVYVVSPDSLTSDQCGWELKEALRLTKRVLPVVWRPIEDAQAPPELKRLNYIFFSGEERTFAAGLAQLAEALRTDVDWIREHTRLDGLAQRWLARERGEALLLRGEDIDAAQAWLADKPMGLLAVTDAQADFIKASSDTRAESERRAARAKAGLLTAVSAAAVVFAALAVFGIWQWRSAKETLNRLGISESGRQLAEYGKVRAEQDVRAANVRLEAEVWLRTAPSSSGYYVVDKGWYQVAANYSGAIAEVEVSGGGRPSVTASGFIIDGGLVHPRYAGEPLLLVLPEAAPDAANPPAAPAPSGQPAPADTLPADAPRQPQGMLGQVREGDERLAARFPALGGAPIAGAELIWKTPVHVAAEPPFMVWRLAAKPPFGWRAVTLENVDCSDLGALPTLRTVAVLGVGIPAEGGPSRNALALNVSELLDGTDVRSIHYTHATNRASLGAPVFNLASGKIFAIHRGSEPDPNRPGMRRGYGYSLKFILNVIRSGVKDAQLGPLCEPPT